MLVCGLFQPSCPSLYLSHADIVFFIFLYQRWIYRVDPKRVNEYGTTGEDHQPQEPEDSEAAPSPEQLQGAEERQLSLDNGPVGKEAVCTEKVLAEKKND